MNCAIHPETAAIANCESCQKPFCRTCLVDVSGKQFCSSCRTAQHSASLDARLPEGLSRPGTAFGLGLIPGVGAICNGEYFKAFVHVIIFGFLISISSGPHVGEFAPLFGLMTSAFYFYMPLEAFQTAKRRLLEAQGFLVPQPHRNTRQDTLWTGVILTIIGLLFFLNSVAPAATNAILRLWPASLILFGAYRIWRFLGKEKIKEESII
jgi:hypothetical protein